MRHIFHRPLTRIFHSWRGRRGVNPRAAGFRTYCVVDFQIGLASRWRNLCGLRNPRYSRLGSLRYSIRCGISALTIPVLLAAAVLLAGCRTGPPSAPDGHLASLVVSGCSEADILRAMQVVFPAHGYQHVSDMNFDKKGSVLQTALYGGWSDDGVWIRLRASVDPKPDGTFVMGCDAFRVTGHNQGVMEEEKPATYGYRDECRRILQEVQSRLASGSTPTAPP